MPEPTTAAGWGQHDGVIAFLRELSWTNSETEREYGVPDIPPEHVEMVGRFFDAKLHAIAHGLIESGRLMPDGLQDAVNDLFSMIEGGSSAGARESRARMRLEQPGLMATLDSIMRHTTIPDVPEPDRTKPEDL